MSMSVRATCAAETPPSFLDRFRDVYTLPHLRLTFATAQSRCRYRGDCIEEGFWGQGCICTLFVIDDFGRSSLPGDCRCTLPISPSTTNSASTGCAPNCSDDTLSPAAIVLATSLDCTRDEGDARSTSPPTSGDACQAHPLWSVTLEALQTLRCPQPRFSS